MALTASDVDAWRSHASGAGLPRGREEQADAERIDLLRGLEDLKATISALQADLALDLDASQRAQQAAAGEPAARQGRGVAAQVALARRESPHRGAVLLGLAKALRCELPHTAAAFRAGRLSEFRALLVARETACLTPDDRAEVDQALCGDSETLEGVGTARLVGLVRRHATRLDPASAARRARRAETERYVSLRPAPDTMTYLTALLPVTQGVAAYAALRATAAAARAAGDPRCIGQVMADTLIERLTGQTNAADLCLNIDLVISDAALLGGSTEPAQIPGHGQIPAEIARELIAHNLDSQTMTWIRRLYTDPAGDLVAMTSRQRLIRGTLADYLTIRDQGLCRTPWCDAPAANRDHVTAAAEGGETSAINAQALCQACNLAKQAPAWTQRPRPPRNPGHQRHQVETTTPTGHHYHSTAPPPPEPSRSLPTPLDRALDRLLAQLQPPGTSTALRGKVTSGRASVLA